METIKVDGGVDILSWCPELDDKALAQAKNVARHPNVISHVALMPDCHMGYGMPIGGVAALRNAVSPAMIGYDIGCGMAAIETNWYEHEISYAFDAILSRIREHIPCGHGKHHKKKKKMNWPEWDMLKRSIKGLPWATKHCLTLAKNSMGTLGSGNHFIEIQKEMNGKIWVMLHSGSRKFGWDIADYYMKIAAERDPIGNELGVPCLCLDHDEFAEYLQSMNVALAYAKQNRAVMMECVKSAFSEILGDSQFGHEISIQHNFAQYEFLDERGGAYIHRKGATSAYEGQEGIIPGSMGTASYIVEGKGNQESFCSCSHGAGRRRGRKQTIREVDTESALKSISHVKFAGFSTVKRGKLKGQLDIGEAPAAYKDIDDVILNQIDLISVLHRLEPIGVVKGD